MPFGSGKRKPAKRYMSGAKKKKATVKKPKDGHSGDMKKAMKGSKYYGQVYVVTSSGNNWYYPKQLRLIREN